MFLGLIGILENPIHKITIVSVLFSAMITHGLMNSVQIGMFLFVKWHLMVILFTLLAPFLPAVWFLSTHFCKSYCKVAYTLMSRLEAYAGFFRLSFKGKFDVYLQWFFGEKLNIHLLRVLKITDNGWKLAKISNSVS